MRHGIATVAAVWWALGAGLALGQPGAARDMPGPPEAARQRVPAPGRAAPHAVPRLPRHRWLPPGPGVYPDSYFYSGYGWPYYPPGYGYGPVYYPPVWMPAEHLYGPQAVQRFMGARPPPGAARGASVVAVLENGEKQQEEDKKKKPNLRGTNRQSLDLAWRFIGFGDAHFENQKYLDANQRYRKATQAAPQLADARFRHGCALIALGRYDAAAKAIKRGLALDPDWPKSNFKVDDLYGRNQMAKKAHLDVLAKEAGKDPNNADLLFLVGVFLHFDGQPQRAKVFFQKAAQLAAGDDAHIRAFQ